MAKRKRTERVRVERVVRRALLIDDEAATLQPILAQGLQEYGFDVVGEARPDRAISTIAESKPDIVLLDLHFPGDSITTTGARLLTEIRKCFDSVPVVVFTTRLDDVSIATESFEEKPHGYIAKPKFGTNRDWPRAVIQALHDAIDTVRFASDVSNERLGFFVGHTKEMREVAAQVRVASRNSLPVVIFGESGTGKRTVAEAIHRESGRAGCFEHYRCLRADAKSLDLVLFGQATGTSAEAKNATGLFALAHEGTFFLDGIERASDEVQLKLATFIKSGAFQTAGVTKETRLDVHIIVATNHSFADLVGDGVLGEEFAERLQGTIIALPPLRTRTADLPDLFELFVSRANEATGRHVLPRLRQETLAKLEQHSWPGNIRELESTILRAVAKTSANVLLPNDIDFAPVVPLALATPVKALAAPSNVGSSSASLEANGPDVVVSLVDQIESLEPNKRYDFLKGLGERLRTPVVEEFIRRLRKKLGKRVGGKHLAAALAPDTPLVTVRQYITTSCKVRLTQLEWNQ